MIVAMMTPAIRTSPTIGASVHVLFAVVLVLFHAARAPDGRLVNVVAVASDWSILYHIISPMMTAMRKATTPTTSAGIPAKASWFFSIFIVFVHLQTSLSHQ